MKTRTRTKVVVLLLALFLLAGGLAPVKAGSSQVFSDVPAGKWYYPYVMNLYNQGIVSGWGNTGTFRPDNPVIREHAAKMICLAAGLPDQGQPTHFADQQQIAPKLAGYVAALVDKGAIGGFPDNTFRPKANIKRGHVCKIVALAFELEAGKMSVSLNDLSSLSPDVRDSIMVLASNGIVGGYGTTGQFRPDNQVSRAELCKILCVSMAVAAVQRLERDPSEAAVLEARAAVGALPYDHIPDTVADLDARIEFVAEDLAMAGTYGDYYWRDVHCINRLIEFNGMGRDKWLQGATTPPSDWSSNVAWSLTSPRRVYRIQYYSEPAKLSGAINLRALSELQKLLLPGNEVDSINVKGCHKLEKIICGNNRLPTLDLTGLVALKELEVYNNGNLSWINLLTNTSLERLICNSCNFSILDVSFLPALKTLDCSSNKLTSLTLSPQASYQAINVRYNLLSGTGAIINGGHIPWDTGEFFFTPQK